MCERVEENPAHPEAHSATVLLCELLDNYGRDRVVNACRELSIKPAAPGASETQPRSAIRSDLYILLWRALNAIKTEVDQQPFARANETIQELEKRLQERRLKAERLVTDLIETLGEILKICTTPEHQYHVIPNTPNPDINSAAPNNIHHIPGILKRKWEILLTDEQVDREARTAVLHDFDSDLQQSIGKFRAIPFSCTNFPRWMTYKVITSFGGAYLDLLQSLEEIRNKFIRAANDVLPSLNSLEEAERRRDEIRRQRREALDNMLHRWTTHSPQRNHRRRADSEFGYLLEG